MIIVIKKNAQKTLYRLHSIIIKLNVHKIKLLSISV